MILCYSLVNSAPGTSGRQCLPFASVHACFHQVRGTSPINRYLLAQAGAEVCQHEPTWHVPPCMCGWLMATTPLATYGPCSIDPGMRSGCLTCPRVYDLVAPTRMQSSVYFVVRCCSPSRPVRFSEVNAVCSHVEADQNICGLRQRRHVRW